MNLILPLSIAICFSSLGAAAPVERKEKNPKEQFNLLRLLSTKNSSTENSTLREEKSETTTFGRRIRSIVARRRTTSKAQEVALKDSALSYIEENYADLTKFEAKDFEDLYRQLGYK